MVRFLAVFLQANMQLDWWPRCYMMDSSIEGAGFGCCDATQEELQNEARYAETRGWTATLEELVFKGLPAEEVLAEANGLEASVQLAGGDL